jgi:hypothetical protein
MAQFSTIADTTQPLAVVEGKNWLVVDLSEGLHEPPSGKNLQALAQELGGVFRSLNGASS